MGSSSLTSGSATVSLSGSAVFTSGSSYVCYGSDTSTPATTVTFAYTDGTAFTVTAGSGSDAVRWICIGT